MAELRTIDPTPYVAGLDPAAAPPLGRRPELRWIPVAQLVVDPRYQREITTRGARNVRAIAEAFTWLKFGVAIVAPLPDGRYAIVDGQHRTLGASGRGLDEVPCLVIDADAREQAAAFVGINAGVTQMTSLQIFASRLASGDPGAAALAEACRAGGVAICRYPVPGNKMRAGETLAVGALDKALRAHGAGTLSLALRCITGTNGGNPGLVRAPMVKALCAVLGAEPAYARDERRLLAAFEEFCIETELENAGPEARRRKVPADAVVAGRIRAHLAGAFRGAVAAPRALAA